MLAAEFATIIELGSTSHEAVHEVIETAGIAPETSPCSNRHGRDTLAVLLPNAEQHRAGTTTPGSPVMTDTGNRPF